MRAMSRLEYGMKKSKLEEYYGRRVAAYEQIYERPERQKELAILTKKIKNTFKDLDVLEIACGTGYWTQFISPEARSILAIDSSEEVLGFARRKEYSRGNATFLVDDAYLLSKVSGEFNGGFCGFWWSHVPKNRINHFLTTFHAKLKKGAIIVMIDNKFVEGNSTPISKFDEEGNSYQLRKLSGGKQYEVLKNYPSEIELKDVIGKYTNQIEISGFSYYWLLKYSLK